MKMIKATLIALAVMSASATTALANDGVSSQGNLTQTGQDTTDFGNRNLTNRQTVVKELRPSSRVDVKDREIMQQNARDPK
jgi:hypothetical protein